ncbi:MAG: thioredoxin family protein [Verrucomicrobia bacterium]|nr:MAG: thioredoxin family protein [Verrucomicrobiota bacterium]
MPTIATDSMPSGHALPAFSLRDVVKGTLVSNESVRGAKALLVIFLCRHCPYVVHVQKELRHLADDYQPRGTTIIGISSNDSKEYPEDAPDMLREMALEVGFPFPILFDESQDVARAFTAACTPDFFLFDSDARLAYRGRLDESTPGNGLPVTGRDLRAALDAVLAGQPVLGKQFPSRGCGIKWTKSH